ncbi:carboxymuconolactone decarboxylase family protein [Rhodococcus sp. IEGM 1408]|uniref:carboxymuconolactone decarboxylase family protein n=1 Tax=Rhodococcus sp. IEGM 1408 TaxID=3082220 RepID=UPI0029541137|nr:carboxymuconolactone decarboxylase family protein [Rhodococcus sp. IEGM 1408]MDV7999853.1 carboxymuconolactone decarboxylase family protein [Rhodococcus sp. IEGM 1408]
MSTQENTHRQRKQISAAATAPMVALEAYTRTRVSRSDSHLIRLRVSAVNGCRFCTAMHRRDARKDGWDDARIAAAEDWPTHAGELSAGDLTVLRFADAVTHIHGEESVSDELWDDVVRHRGEAGTGQLLMEVVTINAWNRIAVTTRKDPGSLRGVHREDIDPVRPGH